MLHTQPGRCLYTTVRELVENSLDAAESIGMLPDIDVEMCVRAAIGLLAICTMHSASTSSRHKMQHFFICSSEMAQSALNDIRGMANLSRVDEALYHDHETEAECKVAGDVCTFVRPCKLPEHFQCGST
jgi:DNA topoisomerase VI subunit B